MSCNKKITLLSSFNLHKRVLSHTFKYSTDFFYTWTLVILILTDSSLLCIARPSKYSSSLIDHTISTPRLQGIEREVLVLWLGRFVFVMCWLCLILFYNLLLILYHITRCPNFWESRHIRTSLVVSTTLVCA